MTDGSSRNLPRILVFNQQSRPEARDLLKVLHQCLQPVEFDHVIFCTNVTRKVTGYTKGKLTLHHLINVHQLPNTPYVPDFVNRNHNPSAIATLAKQNDFADVWRNLDPSLPSSNIHLLPTIQEAVQLVDDLCEELGDLQIFVIGSLHLIGGVLSILEDG